MLENIHKLQAIWAGVLSLGFSIAIVAGYLYDSTSFLSLNAWHILIIVLLTCVFAYPFYFILVQSTCGGKSDDKSPRDHAEKHAAKHAGKHARMTSTNARDLRQRSWQRSWQPTKRDICLMLLLICIPQLILWAIAWPGIYEYDGSFHVLQLNTTEENHVDISSKYSVLYTLLLGGAVKLAKPYDLVQVAFASVMFMQIAITIYAQAKACKFVGKQSSSKVLFWISALFFALHPFIIMIRISSCQDTLFGAFMLLAIIEAFQLGQTVCAGRDVAPKTAVRLVVFVTLMCLMRNNGLYLYAFAVIFTAPLLVRNKLFKTGGVLALPIILVLIVTGPIYNAAGVVKYDKSLQEMMSIPSQQITRSLAVSPETFTQVDMDNLNRFYHEMDDIDYYWEDQSISDIAKDRLNCTDVKADFLGYVGFYLSVGLKNPGNYLDAFAMNTLGWWYPLKSYPDSRIYHLYVYYDSTEFIDYNPDFTPIDRNSICPLIDKCISYANYRALWNKVSDFKVLFDVGIYSWIFFTLCVIACLNKRRDARLAFLMIAGLYLTYLLSPLCYFRYAFAMITCVPVLLLVCFPARPLYDVSNKVSILARLRHCRRGVELNLEP